MRCRMRSYSQEKSSGEEPLYKRLADAWRNTPTKWYPLPVAAGALLLIILQYRRSSATQDVVLDEHGNEVVRLHGPWHVHVLGALPLRNLSRLWGYLNSLELPVWFRPYGFRLYAWIFGCNLDEIDPPDLTHYRSLGEFFYRKLKDGARPIADAVLVSPADGRVLHLGVIKDGKIEQVKGSTYSLDALLGVARPGSPAPSSIGFPDRKMEEVDHKQFAEINGIDFTSVRTKPGNDTFFIVIYLAPGDYHRFHSPTSWVVERRRHFVGDLFSVSPWMAKRLPNLFVLNERVALLGRWRYGFFSMVPVGATNVGSIKINFDQALRTNVGSRREHPVGTYTEAVYSGASAILNGQPLNKGDEMGGFCLGSTIVLVFEAPYSFKFDVAAGEKVKVGQRLGDLASDQSTA
ncbi:hypothetical protein BN946_scf184920.g4 [Trametes cinnabarina]|uniref:Phosphatidylserine decarboxylase proenzyme 1, mitochondrial n=1 Tax=Pycnoporus cinnabarinus TaxID=5643 RepID=A0A060SBJ0_PYCCI|nr:hypothetical protein BN946_scf184920.g4 [Trametes cinnabarina]